jgi:hypothetical protein
MSQSKKFLGDYVLPELKFAGLDAIFHKWQEASFQSRPEFYKQEAIHEQLFRCIQGTASGFLLIPILHFIQRVVEELSIPYTFSLFELWLNQFSRLSFEENCFLRGKIMGKWIPREDYQVLFPIGMKKVLSGSHLVTAHSSPDLDTTIASFWGWVDAFAARVGDGLHWWNVPGTPPKQMEVDQLFYKIFGKNVFQQLAKSRTTLSINSLDLMSQRAVIKKLASDSTLSVDHERTHNVILIVDEEGFFLGDWRSIDVEGVRQIVALLNNCLTWLEKNLHAGLISLFSKETLKKAELAAFLGSLFSAKIANIEPVYHYTSKQKDQLDLFLKTILHISEGINASFNRLGEAFQQIQGDHWRELQQFLTSEEIERLFNREGLLVENRPALFSVLKKIFYFLDRMIHSIFSYLDRLGIALKIKQKVLGYNPQYLTHRTEVDEIRSKIAGYFYLSVLSEENDRQIPLGVVYAQDVGKNVLGTVSLRDFSNREETKIPSYLEVVSVIDHHKSALNTLSPSVAFIADAQSSNGLVAEQAFILNDRYSTGGMTQQEIEEQIEAIKEDLSSASQKRVLQRLLQRKIVLETQGPFFVDPMREFVEYLHFLYAVLDDTDLLTKVSHRDLILVASLLNRLKSLLTRREQEIISFDDLPRDNKFVEIAAQRLLQNNDMYSLYRKIYLHKEQEIDRNLRLCVEGRSSTIFSDTKEQNGCARVGQTKLFARNFSLFFEHIETVRRSWYYEAVAFYEEHPEYDLHIQMISTLAGAEDLYAGSPVEHTHRDELWIWVPFTEAGVQHLKSFLSSLQTSPQIINNRLELECRGEYAKEYEQIFRESFSAISRVKGEEKLEESLVILRFKAGAMNSRKEMISPYLPKVAH